VQWNHRVAALEPAGDALTVRVQRLGKASSGYAVAHSGWVVDAETVKHPRYVIGADGHDSLVRRHIGIELQSTDEPSLYAVFEMAGNVALERELRIVLGARTTDVLWPLPGNRCRWSFELEDDQQLRLWREKSRMAFSLGERAFPHLGPGAFGELVHERAPWFPLDKVADTAWSVLVRFERSLATRFGSGRAWLCGDAAHLAGPLAVRSMNVGLREARDLAERLANGLSGADAPALLEAYERERLAEWRGLLELERGAVGARQGERILACLPASGPELEQFRNLPALKA
jgi:2-polyprenyl-6-methoxyphenol hydroxylase-like FAD-dependent oxidoreductase